MRRQIAGVLLIMLGVAACDSQTLTMSGFERYVYEFCRDDGGTEEQCLCQSSRLNEELSSTEKEYFAEFFEKGNLFVADKVNVAKVTEIGFQCM